MSIACELNLRLCGRSATSEDRVVTRERPSIEIWVSILRHRNPFIAVPEKKWVGHSAFRPPHLFSNGYSVINS